MVSWVGGEAWGTDRELLESSQPEALYSHSCLG